MTNSTEKKDSDSNSLLKPIDAIVEVSISSDKLQASLKIMPPRNGGLQYNFLSIRKVLSNNKITYGLNTQKLLELCENPIYMRIL